jgi:hypothetical protein
VANLRDDQPTFLSDIKPIIQKSFSPPLSTQLQFPDTTTSDDILLMRPSTASVQPREEKSLSPDLLHVQCHLEMKELWEKFNDLGTEMIITRSGR